MITATDIRQAQLDSAGRGYKKSDVDDLLEKAAQSIEQLQAENADLGRKLEILAERIQEYREEEDSIRSALVTAQKSADKILKDANAEKEQIIGDARAQADEAVRLSQEKSLIIANETREKVSTVLGEAKEKASFMLSDAKERSDKMLSDAVRDCQEEKRYLAFLKTQENEFRQLLVEMYKRQFETLKKGPEIIRHMEEALAAEPEPESLKNAPEPVEQPAIETDPAAVPAEEPAQTATEEATQTPVYTEPEDVPLPVAAKPEEEQPKTEQPEETPIHNGFAVQHKFGELKFGDDYDISSDDDYPTPEV